MSKNTTTTHGKCRIYHDTRLCTLAEALDAGTAILEIRPSRGGFADYWIKTVYNGAGKLIGYRFEKFNGHVEEAPVTYFVMVEHGSAPERWTCNCPDSQFRKQSACKHRSSLHCALLRANLAPVTTPPAAPTAASERRECAMLETL